MKKVNILWSGITGRTGQLALEFSKQNNFVTIVAGVSNSNSSYYNYDELDKIKEKFDVIVDFSHEDNLEKILQFALKAKKPLIIGTYIKDAKHINMIEEASKIIPIFKGGNFRFDVKKFMDDVIEYANTSTEDIVLVETHYKTKKVPSQTALELKEMVLNKTGKQLKIDSRLEYDDLINDYKVNNISCHVQGFDGLIEGVLKVAQIMSSNIKPDLYNLNKLFDE